MHHFLSHLQAHHQTHRHFETGKPPPTSSARAVVHEPPEGSMPEPRWAKVFWITRPTYWEDHPIQNAQNHQPGLLIKSSSCLSCLFLLQNTEFFSSKKLHTHDGSMGMVYLPIHEKSQKSTNKWGDIPWRWILWNWKNVLYNHTWRIIPFNKLTVDASEIPFPKTTNHLLDVFETRRKWW